MAVTVEMVTVAVVMVTVETVTVAGMKMVRKNYDFITIRKYFDIVEYGLEMNNIMLFTILDIVAYKCEKKGCNWSGSVSYTHLTLPTKA